MLRVVAGTSLAVCLISQIAAAEPVFRKADLADNPGRTPSGLAVGDFTGDGALDAVTANFTSGTVTVFVQTAGLLFAMIDIDVGGVPAGVVAGDFDEDGVLDLVVANGSDASVSFVKGLGEGMFEPRLPAIGVGVSPSGMAVADLNKDGNLDVVVANEGLSETAPGSVSVLHGDGDGGFTNQSSLDTDLGTRAIALGDVSGDGNLDIIAANSRGNTFSYFRNLGDGRRFAPGVLVATGTEPVAVAVGLLNADQAVDVVTADKSGVSVFLNSGTGGFPNRTQHEAGNSPYGIAVEDMDLDGNLDVIAANNQSGDVSVLRGNGLGGFTGTRTYVAELQPAWLAIAHTDSDSLPDIITANIVGSDGSLAVLHGRADGAHHAVEDVAAGGGPAGIAVADYDDDGQADMIVSHSNGEVLGFRTQSDGTFAQPQMIDKGERARDVIARDFDRDGYSDLAYVDNELNKVVVLRGIGAGQFGEPTDLITATGPVGVVAGDFNNDDKMDLAVTVFGPPGQVDVFLGNGNGTFDSQLKMTAVGDTPVALAAGDLDRLRGDDLIVANEASNTVLVLLSRGNGQFDITETLSANDSGPSAVAIGRFDADQNLDIVVGNTNASLQPGIFIYLGRGDGTVVRPANTVRTERVDALVARDFTGDQIADLMLVDQTSNSTRLLRGNGMGRFTVDRDSSTNVSRMPVVLGAGDFDADGKYDGLTGNSQTTANNISVLWNCAGEERCAVLPQPAVARGEANGDNAVTAADIVQVVREIADGDGDQVDDIKFNMPLTSTGVDANGDGRVDPQDARAAAHRIFAGG